MDALRKKLERMAAAEVDAIVAALPEPLAEQARILPVIFELRPDAGDEEGQDLLGLFIGSERAAEGQDPLPPQIVLFLENLWDEAGGDEAVFRGEVRITYLHELGHYLGLCEDDLIDRGLE